MMFLTHISTSNCLLLLVSLERKVLEIELAQMNERMSSLWCWEFHLSRRQPKCYIAVGGRALSLFPGARATHCKPRLRSPKNSCNMSVSILRHTNTIFFVWHSETVLFLAGVRQLPPRRSPKK